MDKTSVEVASGHLYLGPVVDAASGDLVNDDPTAIEAGHRAQTDVSDATNRLETAKNRLDEKADELEDLADELRDVLEESQDDWAEKAEAIESHDVGLEKSDITIEDVVLIWIPTR